MLPRSLPVLLTLLALCAAAPLHAQSPSSKGQEFWLGFMENLTLAFNGPPELVIVVSATTGARGTLSVPLTGYTQDFVVVAGETREVRLPGIDWYPYGSNVTGNKGIRITTDAPVSVTAMHYRSLFTESTQVLPLAELGDEYVVLAARDEDGRDPSQLLIVATEDNTQISITPSSLTVDLRPLGSTYTITLNKGQVYQLQARTDLTGTFVKAANAKKIALFAGARQADIACLGDDSHIWDQNYPLRRWGRQYLVVPFADQLGDLVKIVAAFDNTTVSFDCGGTTQASRRLKRGEFVEREITATTFITSDNPIGVAQFMKSNNCNPLGGPNMLVLQPFDLQTKRATFLVPNGFSSVTYRNHINVVTKTDAINRLRLDGRRLNATWKPVESNPLYSFAQPSINAGSHVLSSDSSFYATSYGFDPYDAYTHSLGYDAEVPFRTPRRNVVALDLGRDTTICPGQRLVLDATTLGASGYQWQDGSAGATYTVTQPGEYRVTASGLCQVASGSIKVSYKENALALNLGKDTTLCQGQTLVLDATTAGALAYRWQDGSTGSTYTVTRPGEYKVEVASGACQSASGSIRVAYRELPLPQLGPDTTLCAGQELLLDVSQANASFQWQDGSSKGNYLVSRPGRYKVTVSNGNCTASDEVRVDYEPALPGYALEEKLFGCGSEAVLIDATVALANVNYRWQDGSTGPTLLAPGPGTYRVEIASRCGKVSRTFKVESILPPNVFTPNGDGLNDCFQVPGIDAGEWTLWVYNRWGKPVYQQQGYDNAWCAEGEANGVYYYQLTKAGGPPCPIKGWVQVLR